MATPSCAPRTRNIIPPSGKIVYPRHGRKEAWSSRNDRCPRYRPHSLCAAESLELEQGKRRPLRQHQPPDRGTDARQGASDWQASVPALFAGDAERRQGHRDVRRAAGGRLQRRRIRCLADTDRRQPVRQRFCFGQSEFKNPGADGPQRADADPPVRIRRDPGASRRKVRRIPADRRPGPCRMPVVAVLADGQRALSRRRLRAFLRLRADQDQNTPSTASQWR